MTEKLIFDSTMEGLVRAVSADLAPRCRTRLLEAGFDPAAKIRPAYPAELWATVVKILGQEIYPTSDALEQHRQLANRTIEAFAKSMIGGALFALVGLLGPDRTVRRMTRNFRTGSNYVETTCTEVAPHTYEIGFNDVTGVPGFYLGLLEAGLFRTGAKNLQVTLHSEPDGGAVYRASWSEH